MFSNKLNLLIDKCFFSIVFICAGGGTHNPPAKLAWAVVWWRGVTSRQLKPMASLMCVINQHFAAAAAADSRRSFAGRANTR